MKTQAHFTTAPLDGTTFDELQMKMGSSQSTSITVPEPYQPSTDVTRHENTDTQQRPKKKSPKDLSGPALVEYRCRRKKKAWSVCVGSFYSRFSSGKVLEDEEADCDDLFEQYRECYLRGMLKERERKGLDPPKEGTLLAEFADDDGLAFSKKQ